MDLRTRTKAAISWVAAGLALAACETVTIPTQPEGAPDFRIVQVDVVEPEVGTTFAPEAGTHDYSARVLYQRTAAEQAAGPWPVFAWIETFEFLAGPDEFFWEGDLAFGRRAITGERGEVTVEGTFSLPTVGPFCGSIDLLRAFVAVGAPAGTDTVAVIPSSDLSQKEDISGDVGTEIYAVSDFPAPTDPCVIYLESVLFLNRFEFQWGEPVWIWGRRLPEDSPIVGFGGGAATDFTLSFAGDSTYAGSWDLVSTWIPSGAVTGAIDVTYGGTEAEYGSDDAPVIRIDDGAGDFFEPNDAWDDAADDAFIWGDDIGWIINPGLTIDLVDREVDPAGNPGGLTAWGKGDWWHMSVPAQTCIEVHLFQEVEDDLDLFLYDEADNVRAFNGFGFGSDWITVSDSTGGAAGTRLDWRVWVAPGSGGVSSDHGAYSLYALNCELLAGASPEARAALAAERGPSAAAGAPLSTEALLGEEARALASGGSLARGQLDGRRLLGGLLRGSSRLPAGALRVDLGDPAHAAAASRAAARLMHPPAPEARGGAAARSPRRAGRR